MCRSTDKVFVIGDNPVIILEHEENLISDGKYSLAIDAKIFMMPISPTDVLVFFDDSVHEKIYNHVSNSNNWQFANSVEFVFGHTKESLEDGIKLHYKNAYEYIKSINPNLVTEHNIKKGSPISIGQMKYSFEGNAIKYLRGMI